MKLLLIGSTGLLGTAVAKEAERRGYNLFTAARSGAAIQLDVSDEKQLHGLLEELRPDVIFNCAALTDIEACETDRCLAYSVNARPLAHLASWSGEAGRALVHISTDHFFVGEGDRAHSEREAVTLVNEYARTKFAGEAFALTSPNALVLRTSILGMRGWTKPTLAEWAIQSINSAEQITLFDDAFTSSLDTDACAGAALDLLETGTRGLMNVGAREVYSKGDLVRELARQLGRRLNQPRSGSVTSLTPKRADSLGLDVTVAEARLGYRLPGLESVVAAVVDQCKGYGAL